MGQRGHQTLVKMQQFIFVLAQEFRFDQVGDEGREGRFLRKLRCVEFVKQG